MKEEELHKIISDTIINNLDPDSFPRTVHNSTVDLIEVFNDFASQDKWISVEERLPDEGELILQFINHGDSFEYYSGGFQNKYYKQNGVTYWQPLPKAPNTK